MPKLWTATVETHREKVQEAVLDAAAQLMRENGALAVTMSAVADRAGIGRATLYKYFPDVEAVLVACHERHVARHLDELRRLRDEATSPAAALAAVLTAYGRICHFRARHGAPELDAVLHRGERADLARQQLIDLVRGLLERSKGIRDDVPLAELASYCLRAMEAAADADDAAAVERLLPVTLAGLKASRRREPARARPRGSDG